MKSEIYWLTRLDYAQVFLGVLIGCFIIAVIFIGIHIAFEEQWRDDEGKENRKWFKRAIVGCVITSLAAVFVPSKNDMILIIAGDATYQYIQKDTSLQKLPYKAAELLKDVLDKEIETIKKK
jgi:hypothetical protein